MKWFGESWGAPICDPTQHVETPDGEACGGSCKGTIHPGDRGLEVPYFHEDGFEDTISYHLDCFLREIGLRPK